MSDLHEQLKKQEEDLVTGQLYEGIVVATITNPGLGVQIRLPDQDKSFGPMPWPERASVLGPTRGDRALFTKSDQDAYWCVGWWPYAL